MMIDAVSYRRLEPDDYQAIISVWREAGLPFRQKGRESLESYLTQLKDEHINIVGAFAGEKMVGVVVGSHDGRKGWVNRLAVVPRMQNQGIAGKLVAIVEEFFQNQGIKMYAALINEDNEASINLFQKLGYEPKSEIKYFRKFFDHEF